MEGFLYYQRSNKALTRHKCKLIINPPSSNSADSDRRASFQEDKLVVYKSEDESKFKFCIYLDEMLKISIFADLSWELHINSGKKYRFTTKNWREDQKWFGMIYKNLVDRYRNFYLSPGQNNNNDDDDDGASDRASLLTADGNLRFMPSRPDSSQNQNETNRRYPLDLNDIYDLVADLQKTSPHLRQQFADSVFRIRIAQDQIVLKDRNSDKNFTFYANTIKSYGAKSDGLLIELGENSEFGAGLVVFKAIRYPYNQDVYKHLLDLIQTNFTKKWLDIKEEDTTRFVLRNSQRSHASGPNPTNASQAAFENATYTNAPTFANRNGLGQVFYNPEVNSLVVRNGSFDDDHDHEPYNTVRQTTTTSTTQNRRTATKMVPAAAATLATPEPADDVQVTSFMGSSEPATTPRQRATNVSAQPPPATAQTFERQSWNAQVYTPPRLETAEVVEPAPRAPPPPLQAQPTGVKNTTPLVSVKRQIPIQVDYKSLNPRPTSSYANMDQNQNHNNSLLNNKKNMSYSKSLTNLLADDDEKDESCSDNDKSKSRSGNLLDEENYAAKSPTKRFERGTVRTQVKTTYHKQHHIVKKFGSNNELSTTEELANDKHETYDSDTTEFTEESFYKDIYGPNLTTTTTTTSQPTSKIITESYV